MTHEAHETYETYEIDVYNCESLSEVKPDATFPIMGDAIEAYPHAYEKEIVRRVKLMIDKAAEDGTSIVVVEVRHGLVESVYGVGEYIILDWDEIEREIEEEWWEAQEKAAEGVIEVDGMSG